MLRYLVLVGQYVIEDKYTEYQKLQTEMQQLSAAYDIWSCTKNGNLRLIVT